MNVVTAAAFLEIVDRRRGHFRLESGHHSALWLDLDPLFAEPRRVEPFVTALAAALRPHDVSVVCGPLLGGAFLAQLISRALGAQFCFTERVMPAESSRSAIRADSSVARIGTRQHMKGWLILASLQTPAPRAGANNHLSAHPYLRGLASSVLGFDGARVDGGFRAPGRSSAVMRVRRCLRGTLLAFCSAWQ